MNVIFDLDGTLVNSAPGMLAALSYAMEKYQIENPWTLYVDLIRPTLREMLIHLSRSSKADDLDLMEQKFKSYYDEIGKFEVAQYEA